VQILTIGHSTRTLDDFIGILRTHGVARIVDIRTIPRSRHNPQFNQETLSKKLKESAIDYVLMKQLGGLRHPRQIPRTWVGRILPSEDSLTTCRRKSSRKALTRWLS